MTIENNVIETDGTEDSEKVEGIKKKPPESLLIKLPLAAPQREATPEARSKGRKKKLYFGTCPEGCVCISDQEAKERGLSACRGNKYLSKRTGPKTMPGPIQMDAPCGLDKTNRRHPVYLYCYEL